MRSAMLPPSNQIWPADGSRSPGHQRDGRRFSGAVRSEQAEDRARCTAKLTSRIAGVAA
jgi:hypothetical protein